MKEIRVEVDQNGRIKILYSGFVGDECFRDAQKLYALLKSKGVDVTVEQVIPTQEYYTTQQAQKSKVFL
jgi:hypothetical protein